MPSHDGSLLRVFPRIRLYIAGTMRSQPDTSEQRAWLKEHNVSVIHLVRMSDDIISDFALKTAEDLGIRLSNETLTAVVTTNDRRPQVVRAYGPVFAGSEIAHAWTDLAKQGLA